MTDSDKYSSLLRYGINYYCKKFYSTEPWHHYQGACGWYYKHFSAVIKLERLLRPFTELDTAVKRPQPNCIRLLEALSAMVSARYAQRPLASQVLG
jgi:hypothetical protein